MADSHALTFGDTATSDDKNWGLLAHLSIYVAAFMGPLVVWLIFKDKSPFIKYHAMQALILQAAMWISGALLGFIITVVSFVTCGFGSVLYLAYLLYIPLAFVPLWGAYRAYEGAWEGFPGMSNFGR